MCTNAFISLGSYNDLVKWGVNILPNIQGPRTGTNLMLTLVEVESVLFIENLIDVLVV